MYISNSKLKNLTAVFLFLFFCKIWEVDADADSKRLISDLLVSYQYLERPVLNAADPIDVNVSLTLLRLADVCESEMSILTNVWLSMKWKDANLVWDSADYSGVDQIRLPIHKIWSPDLHIYNQVGYDMDPTHKTEAIVKQSGDIHYVPPGIFTTSCIMSLEDYPFDEQNCEFKFGSWTHDGSQVNLLPSDIKGADITSFHENVQWELLGFPVTRNVNFYACCVEPYVDLTYKMQIRRKGLKILNMAKSINFVIYSLILLSTLLPPSTGHKINLGVFAVGICIYASKLFNPEPDSILGRPRLATYFIRLLLVAVTSFLGNTIVYYIYNRKGSMPSKVKTLLDKIVTCLKPICPLRQDSNSVTLGTELSDGIKTKRSARGRSDSDVQELISEVQNLNDAVSRRRQEMECIMSDWNYLAIVMDRCFFVFWIVFVPLFQIALFPSYKIS